MQDLEVVDPLNAVFASVASLTTADVTPKADRSERIEIYDSSATCHISLYIEAFTNFEFITLTYPHSLGPPIQAPLIPPPLRSSVALTFTIE